MNDYKVIIVGDYPAQSDVDNGTIMESEKERTMWGLIEKVLEVDPNEFAACYMLPRPDEGKKHSDKTIKDAGEALKAKLKRLKPDAIICLGESVLNGLCGVKGISAHRGSVFHLETDEFHLIPIVPTFSPSYVSNATAHLQTFAMDMHKAYQLACGKEESKGNSVNVLCDTMDKAYDAIDYALKTGVCCFDYETTTLTDMETFDPDFKATLLSISFQQGSSYSIPLYHYNTPFTEDQLDEFHLYFIERILQNPEVHKIAHNLKFDLHVAHRYGLTKPRGRYSDTMLMHHLIDETTKHGLKELTKTYYPEYEGYEREVKRYAWDKVPLKILAPYGGLDTDLTLRLHTYFLSLLLQDERVYCIFRNLTMPSLFSLLAAEERGMLIDREEMLRNIKRAEELQAMVELRMREHPIVLGYEKATSQRKIDEKIAELIVKRDNAKGKMQENYQTKINDIKLGGASVYEGINFRSVPQLGELLYGMEGFGFRKPYDKKKRREAESTGKSDLLELGDKSGFIDDLLLWRSISKTLSTYLYGILDRLDKNDRVHTSFLIHGTASGRLSSQNPNLQNLTNVSKLTDPIAIEVVSMVKKPFIPPAGKTLVQIDYSQAELRIIASFAGETAMLEAYDAGLDLHALYASRMLNVTLDAFYQLDPKMQKQWRTRAKAGNFGLIYGMSAEGLVIYAKDNYGVVLTLAEATTMRNAFFAMYPKLLEYHDTYTRKGIKFGYVRTLYGRKRHLPDILNPDEYVRSMDERVAINSPVQGTAGEFTIFATTLLHNRLHPEVEFVNTVHDSIILYIPDEMLDEQLALAKWTCENLPNEKYFGRELTNVSMAADIEVSKKCWKELSSYQIAA